MVGVFPWQIGRNPPFFLDIPVNEYYEYFGPDYQLDVKSSNTEDLNSPAYLERVKNIVMEHLRHVGGPPSVQMTGTCCRMIFK
jgi:histone deacetylase 1/2